MSGDALIDPNNWRIETKMLIRLLANGAPVCDRLWSHALVPLLFVGKSFWPTAGLSRRNVGAPAHWQIC